MSSVNLSCYDNKSLKSALVVNENTKNLFVSLKFVFFDHVVYGLKTIMEAYIRLEVHIIFCEVDLTSTSVTLHFLKIVKNYILQYFKNPPYAYSITTLQLSTLYSYSLGHTPAVGGRPSFALGIGAAPASRPTPAKY